jgi:hypothetical protein
MMFSGGRGTVGFCGTTKSRIDISVSWTENCSGVGQRGRMHLRCHARVPILARMGGVGEKKSAAMIADRQFDIIDCYGA